MIPNFRFYSKRMNKIGIVISLKPLRKRVYVEWDDTLSGTEDIDDNGVLMQSTGMFDNSTPEKEIFEGDVLRDSESIVIVKFADGAFSVDYRNMGGEWRSYGSLFRYLKDYEGEIIGNIFEHNHLLK